MTTANLLERGIFKRRFLPYLIVLHVAVGSLEQVLPLALDVLGAGEPGDQLGPAGTRSLQVVVLDATRERCSRIFKLVKFS